MSLCLSSRKSDRFYLWVAASLILVQSAYSASVPFRQQQESSQRQQQSSQAEQQSAKSQQSAQEPPNSQTSLHPEPKQKKVWTNDDILSLRSPADIYLAEKEAQEAAAEEAARKEVAEAKLTKKAGLTGKLPATVEETQKLVDAKQAHIANDQKTLERYTAELPNEPVEHRERMQAEIERISSDLPRERLELKMLQDHLAELNQAKPNEPPSPPVAPPPS